MKRREERDQAFLLIFEAMFHGEDGNETIYQNARDARDLEESEYAKITFFGVMNHQAELDEKIVAFANGWRLNRIEPVTLTALRLSAYEMLYQDEYKGIEDYHPVPFQVSINEALELIKTYGDPSTVAFANAILDKIRESLS